jgi:hypothetical protein
MLGPVLEAVSDWILKPCDKISKENRYSSNSSKNNKNDTGSQNDRGDTGNKGTPPERPQSYAGFVIEAIFNAGSYSCCFNACYYVSGMSHWLDLCVYIGYIQNKF